MRAPFSHSVLGLATTALVALSALSTANAQPPAAGAGVSAGVAGAPRFESAPCPIEVEPGERIDCGALFVPENRARPGSRTLRLPVMIFRSPSASPAPDPLLFMSGGPGNSTVANRRSGKGNPFLDQRDYILLEQRGARYAEPALLCPEVTRLQGELASGRLRGALAETARVASAAACRKTLVESGVDLDAYTSQAAADDIEDLRLALGFKSWNLYGLSYSTRLMLTVARRHPVGVRSLVLNSVLPPEVHFDEVATANLWRALDLVFSGCAIDRECGAAYPDLRRTFLDLVAAADRAPLQVPLEHGTREVRGADIVSALYDTLHDSEAIPLLPRLIGEIAAGRLSELGRMLEPGSGVSSLSPGLRYSVWCSEELPFENPQRVALQTSLGLGLGGIDERAASVELCRAWNVAAAPPIENEPVQSDIPTLIFAGEFDPDTPPDWGRQLLESMPHAYYVELRGQSHGAGFHPCGREITAAFLRTPASPPAVGCLLQMRGADFGASARKIVAAD
ncbi:MAG: alpha/beta hydrolase [Thermoanaerobaculia bacterium]